MTFPVLLDYSVDTTKSVAFKVPMGVIGMAVYIPSKVNGAVNPEVYTPHNTEIDANSSVLAASTDTNWAVLDSDNNGTPVAIADSTIEGTWIGVAGVDLDAVKGVAGKWARFVDAAAEGADITYYVNFNVSK